MVNPQIEKLLIVQHHDLALLKIEEEISRLPVEQKALETMIENENAEIESARQSLLSKELMCKEVDKEIKTKENELLRFRTQQFEVKKNDEYKALTNQIEQTEADISSLEEREIELMLEIDSAKEEFEQVKTEINNRIEKHRSEINSLIERERSLKTSLDGARTKAKESRMGVDATYLEQYERVKKMMKRAPYVVPIEANKCSGCHLKVSNEIMRGVLNPENPQFCDQCSRMVYV